MSTFIASADRAASGARWHLIDADGQVLDGVGGCQRQLHVFPVLGVWHQRA
jgi:hypothetical protein